MNADYPDKIALLANTPTQAESWLHSLEQKAGGRRHWPPHKCGQNKVHMF